MFQPESHPLSPWSQLLPSARIQNPVGKSNMSLSVWSTHDSLKSLHLIFCSGTPGGIRAAAWAGAPVTQWWRWGWEEVSIRSTQRGMLWQRTARFFFPFLFQHLKQTQGDDVRKKNWLKITWCRWLIIFAAGLLALMHLLTVLEDKLGMAKHRYTHAQISVFDERSAPHKLLPADPVIMSLVVKMCR